jgi:hypothetical protein
VVSDRASDLPLPNRSHKTLIVIQCFFECTLNLSYSLIRSHLSYSRTLILSYSVYTPMLPYSHTLILSYRRRFSLLATLSHRRRFTSFQSCSSPPFASSHSDGHASSSLSASPTVGCAASACSGSIIQPRPRRTRAERPPGTWRRSAHPPPAARLLPFSKPTRRPRRAVARHSLAHLSQSHVPRLGRNMWHRPEGHPVRPAECAEFSINAKFSCEQHRWQSEHVISGFQRSSAAISVPMTRRTRSSVVM